MESEYEPRRVAGRANQFVILSGCSGGGKSSLLAELGRRGYGTYEEPGRQVVKEQLLIGGDALPWENVDLFLELTISRSLHHLIEAARSDRIAFFDRGIVDQVNGWSARGLEIPKHLRNAVEHFRYREAVFVVPPWREIFANDAERRHGFEESAAMYETLVATYAHFGYRPVVVPKMDVSARADFVVAQL
ncbi:MAG TPA: AAA family ATPase [Rhizomicrobium sp.]|nr:AAA family ATPase [Rhizomicrobium sp.]